MEDSNRALTAPGSIVFPHAVNSLSRSPLYDPITRLIRGSFLNVLLLLLIGTYPNDAYIVKVIFFLSDDFISFP